MEVNIFMMLQCFQHGINNVDKLLKSICISKSPILILGEDFLVIVPSQANALEEIEWPIDILTSSNLLLN